LAGCGFGWRCQQNSDYQPVGLHFASLPAIVLAQPKTKPNFFTSPYLQNNSIGAIFAYQMQTKTTFNYYILQVNPFLVNKKPPHCQQ
jgi:uncharacterized protein YigE (DUF2233 family)